jgi:hypothetical protein
MRGRAFADSLHEIGGTRMRDKVRSKAWRAAVAVLLSGCSTMQGQPERITGVWGGPHVGIDIQGGLADVQFDCGSGTIDDPLYPAPDGSFSGKGTYRTGAMGPIKVGQFFKSQDAAFSGRVVKGAPPKGTRVMTLNVALEDGTALGPFTLSEGAAPQLTRCA